MATLLERVTGILANSFKDFDHHLERVPGTGRIVGFLVSTSFRGKDDEKRQRMLWSRLRAELSPGDLVRVGAIVAMTPEEAAIHESDD